MLYNNFENIVNLINELTIEIDTIDTTNTINIKQNIQDNCKLMYIIMNIAEWKYNSKSFINHSCCKYIFYLLHNKFKKCYNPMDTSLTEELFVKNYITEITNIITEYINNYNCITIEKIE